MVGGPVRNVAEKGIVDLSCAHPPGVYNGFMSKTPQTWNRQRSDLGTVFYSNDADDTMIYPDASIGDRGGAHKEYWLVDLPAGYSSADAADRIDNKGFFAADEPIMAVRSFHEKLADAKEAK